MKKLAIALGGGGARGLAHVGVLRILEKEKIPIARISGCSMGAMVGGAYALYQNADAVEIPFLKDLILTILLPSTKVVKT